MPRPKIRSERGSHAKVACVRKLITYPCLGENATVEAGVSWPESLALKMDKGTDMAMEIEYQEGVQSKTGFASNAEWHEEGSLYPWKAHAGGRPEL